MTEAEWLACVDPDRLLRFARRLAASSRRKHLLFNVACCRRLWPVLPHAARAYVEAVEAFAEGEGGNERLATALAEARVLEDGSPYADHAVYAALATARSNGESSRAAVSAVRLRLGDDGYDTERRAQCDLLRDLFRLFRVFAVDPVWLTRGTLGVARGLYLAGAFGDLPILADALEDAGCDNADILGHLRGPGPHVRGCWALDLVLGKS
jgi:hypothetical protein